MGNLMKAIAESCPRWSVIKAHLSSLCQVLRNKTWRTHIQRCLTAPGADVSQLNHFTASLTKWRYETVDDVLEQLTKARLLLAGKVRAECFINPQDRVMIDNFIIACNAAWLWTYIQHAGVEVFHPTELSRHWGMVCPCPEHRDARHEGRRHEECWRISRRLREVSDFSVQQTRQAQVRSRTFACGLRGRRGRA